MKRPFECFLTVMGSTEIKFSSFSFSGSIRQKSWLTFQFSVGTCAVLEPTTSVSLQSCSTLRVHPELKFWDDFTGSSRHIPNFSWRSRLFSPRLRKLRTKSRLKTRPGRLRRKASPSFRDSRTRRTRVSSRYELRSILTPTSTKNIVTIWIPDTWIPNSMGIQYSNGIVTYLADHSNTRHLGHDRFFPVRFSVHHLNTRPFDNQTHIYHLNTWLVVYSDGYCEYIQPTMYNSSVPPIRV